MAVGARARRVATTSPCAGAPLTDLPVSTPDCDEDAFARARGAQARWAATPVVARKRIMLRFHDLVLQRQEEALHLMPAESGRRLGQHRGPMGGAGDFGLGRRHGPDGLLKYTEAQTVAHQRFQGFTPPRRIEREQWARTPTPGHSRRCGPWGSADRSPVTTRPAASPSQPA